jgi:hypothetical protein
MKIFNIFTFALAVFSPLSAAAPVIHHKSHTTNHMTHHPTHHPTHHYTPRHSSCPYSYIKSQDKIVKEKCCLGKVCNTAPKTCSKECAIVFMPFYKKCGHILDHSFYNVHYTTSPTHIRKLQTRPTRPTRPTRTHPRTHSKTHPRTHHHVHIPKRRCMDKWGKSCAILKRLNDCKTGKMSSSMKMGCAMTCGACRQQSNIHIMSQRCSKIYNEEVLNKKHYKNTQIPTTCTLWNNGCNNCGVNKGKLTFCTKRMCFRKQKPHCLKYAGITVVSKKPITKCDEMALSNVLQNCGTILRTDLRKMNKKMCKTPCVSNMVKFYNKCFNAPSLKNFFKTLDITIIKPCEEGLKFVHKKVKVKHSSVGRTRDSHNCLLTAGYTWCESTKKCVRIWETPCPKK